MLGCFWTKPHKPFEALRNGRLRQPVPADSSALGHDADSTGLSSSSTTTTSPDTASFYILRDDLLHPVLGGNKVRKLDGLVPELLDEGATDLVTCGGVQSAHLAAVAVVAAEAGLRSHLLVRGEPPQVPTGYHLVTRMYGTEVSYISRAEYADRQAMLRSRAAAVRCREPSAQVSVVSEGGGDPPALLGLLRLVHWMAYVTHSSGCGYCDYYLDPAADPGGCRSAADGTFRAGHREEEEEGEEGEGEGEHEARRVGGGGGAAATAAAASAGSIAGGPASRVSAVQRLPYATTTPYKVVVDAGTGTTAVGLALGIALLGLPWSVHAVTLAGDMSYYESQQEQLLRSFLERYGDELFGGSDGGQHAAAADLVLPRRQEVEPTPVPEPAATMAVAAAAAASEVAASEGPAAAATAGDGMTAEVGRRALAGAPDTAAAAAAAAAVLPLHWLPRAVPRRFGKVLDGEIATCKRIAQMCGIALDPIYSLAAWELASSEAAADVAASAAADVAASAAAGHVGGEQELQGAVPAVPAAGGRVLSSDVGEGVRPAAGGVRPAGPVWTGGGAQCGGGCGSGSRAASGGGGRHEGNGDDSRVGRTDGGRRRKAAPVASRVVMLHGGGALGLHGLAQRYPGAF
ncbi:hypothetical protein PLESTM_001458900 [Pleodorina starrii]|nr:hypothetical protein PLESTM_001458900 [Pleodorina starrii]